MNLANVVFKTRTRGIIIGGTLGILFHYAFIAEASANELTVKDHYKTVYYEQPYTTEECKEVYVGGDKTGDTLGGAVLGAAIGNAIGKDTEATLAGAAIGGLIGHNKSDARAQKRIHCQVLTRYEKKTREVYSHSTIQFVYEGKTYFERFNKHE